MPSPAPTPQTCCVLAPTRCPSGWSWTPSGRDSAPPPQGGCLNSQRVEEPLDDTHACRAATETGGARARPCQALGCCGRFSPPPSPHAAHPHLLLSGLRSPPATRRPPCAHDVSARSWGPTWVLSSSHNPTLLPALPPGWRPQPDSVSIASILRIFSPVPPSPPPAWVCPCPWLLSLTRLHL